MLEASELPSYSDDKYYKDLAEKYLKRVKEEHVLLPVIKQLNACAILNNVDGPLTDEFLHAIFEPINSMNTNLGLDIPWERQASWLDRDEAVEPLGPDQEVCCSQHGSMSCD